MNAARFVSSVAIAVPVSEAAKLVGLGRSKLYNMIGTGELRSFTIGRRRLVATDDLRALVEKYRAQDAALRAGFSAPCVRLTTSHPSERPAGGTGDSTGDSAEAAEGLASSPTVTRVTPDSSSNSGGHYLGNGHVGGGGPTRENYTNHGSQRVTGDTPSKGIFRGERCRYCSGALPPLLRSPCTGAHVACYEAPEIGL